MQIKEITIKDDWNIFFNECGPHTFLHTWEWGEFNKKIGDKIWRLGVFDRDRLIGICLIIKVIARRGSFLFIPHGPLILEITTYDQLLIFFKCLCDYLAELAKMEEVSFVRISPLLANTKENKKIFRELGFQDAPIHMMHPELAWVLDIAADEDKIKKSMRKQTKHCIRKAEEAGVQIFRGSSDENLDKFYDLYKKTVARQEFTPFSKNYLKEELDAFTYNDNILIFLAEYNNELISGAIIVFTKNSGFYHHGASSHKFPKIPASHLIQWEAIKEAKKRGCNYYNLWGIVPDNLATHPWAGLSLFKKGFGGMSEEYIHAQDLILKSNYWITYWIEKIRRIKRGL